MFECPHFCGGGFCLPPVEIHPLQSPWDSLISGFMEVNMHCVDFKNAFDRVPHTILWEML